jgi:predicted ester cyclase
VGQSVKTGFPDVLHEVLEVVEGKGTAAVRGMFSGTNTGSFMGMPATGNQVELPFYGFYEFDSKGMMTLARIVFDAHAFNEQLMKGVPRPANKATELANIFVRKVIDNREVELLPSILADQFTSSAFPVPNANKMQFIEGIKGTLKAFPDLRVHITSQFAEGDKVFTYGRLTGTHQDEFMGVKATGKKVTMEFMDIWTEKEGKLVRNDVVMDMAGLMQQLQGNSAENKMTATKVMDALKKGDLDGVVAYHHPNAQFHGFAPVVLNAAGYKAGMTDLMKSFPDWRFSTSEVIAENDLVVVRHQFDGTHTGAPFQGIPATKRKVTIPATVTFKFVDGKITETWLNTYVLSIMDQLTMPAPAQ